MSAQLRSFLDFLSSPLRLWRRGRRLPARVQVTLLMAGGLGIAVAFALWTVARATPTQADEGLTVDLSVDAETQAVLERVKQLRTQDKDYAAARTVAQQFLDQHPQRDWGRQAVEYEYAATFYSERRWPEALPLFEALVSTYGQPGLNAADEFCLVDDALCMIGIIHHHSDRPQQAIEAYDALVRSYPDSNRAPYALLQVAGVYHRAGDPATALARYRTLWQDYPNSESTDDAQFFIAGVLREQRQLAEALPLLEEFPKKWPDSQYVVSAGMIAAQIQIELGDADGALRTLDETLAKHPDAEQAPVALQELNRALIAADGKLWAAGRGPGQGGAVHAADIERNLERMLDKYAASPPAPGALLDVINYFVQPEWWTTGVGPQARAKVAALAERMLALYPDAPEACAGRGELAEAISATDPRRAEALLNATLDWAVKNNNHEHYVGGMFMKGAFYANTGRPAESRAAFEEVLRREPTDQVAGEARLCIAHTYAREGDLKAAVREFDAVRDNDAYPRDVRATAAFSKALELHAAGRNEAALLALDDVVARFPDERVATHALETRTQLSRPSVVFIDDGPGHSAK